jgi:hypothetical protein
MQYTLLQEHSAFISYPLWVGQGKKMKTRWKNTESKVCTTQNIRPSYNRYMQENKKMIWNQSSKFVENKSYHTKSMELPYTQNMRVPCTKHKVAI